MRFGRRISLQPWSEFYVRCFAWWPRRVWLNVDRTSYDTVWVWLEGYARKRRADGEGRLEFWWGWCKVYTLEAVVWEKMTK